MIDFFLTPVTCLEEMRRKDGQLLRLPLGEELHREVCAGRSDYIF